MKELIKKLLREYEEPLIQRVDFDGFSDPVLIPQFRKYLVKFEGTGKYQKVSDGEKIIFTDTKTGKEYEFNAGKTSPRSILPPPLSPLQPLPPPDLLKYLPLPPTQNALKPKPKPKSNDDRQIFQGQDAIIGMGGSNEQVNEFDNKKELKEFIKMFKKQNKKGYKKNNSNTRSNKRNDK